MKHSALFLITWLLLDSVCLAQQKELTEQIFRLRFQLTTGQAEALKRLREAKKDLARVKTLLRAQELSAAAQSPAVKKA